MLARPAVLPGRSHLSPHRPGSLAAPVISARSDPSSRRWAGRSRSAVIPRRAATVRCRKIPLAGFVLNSFTHTNTSQPQPAAPDFGRNNNFALDQVSLFFAGRITDYAGAFVQGTYDGVGHAFFLDNTDLRLTTPLDLHGTEVRVGLSVNNGPTVQDPYNSTFAWIFPFATSALAPTPTAQPLLAGGLIGNSIGATVYALVRPASLHRGRPLQHLWTHVAQSDRRDAWPGRHRQSGAVRPDRL